MKSFKNYLEEGGHVPIISLDKNHADLNLKETRNEINKNLIQSLCIGFVNPYSALHKVRKVLNGYGIILPAKHFFDEKEGEEIFPITQFGNVTGATTNGIAPYDDNQQDEYSLFFSYELSTEGFYDAFAAILDKKNISDIVDEEE